MSEASEQIAVIEYCALRRIDVFAVPNGGKRNALEAHNLKRQGVKAGVPDLMIPIAKGGYHGLFIEMKVGRNKPTDKQKEWLERLSRNGYKAVVCYGADAAIDTIDKYMGIGGK